MLTSVARSTFGILTNLYYILILVLLKCLSVALKQTLITNNCLNKAKEDRRIMVEYLISEVILELK